MNRLFFNHRAFPLFIVIGILGVAVNTLALVVLREQLGLPLVLASLLASEIALLHNYLLHRVWTFQRGTVRLQHALLFHGIALLTLILTGVLLVSFVQVIGMAYPLANVLAVLLASTTNYLLIAHWAWSALPLHRRSVPFSGVVSAARQRATQVVHWAQPQMMLVARLVVLLAVAWVAVARPGGWGGLAALLLAAALLIRPGTNKREATLLALAAVVVFTSTDYLAWRFGMVNWMSWWIGVPLFIAELFGALHTLGLQYTIWPRQEPQLTATDDHSQLPVYIFIPTVNEGTAILEPTLIGAIQARNKYLAAYPHAQITIVLCNDGRVANAPNWQETEVLAQRMGVQCITRTVKGGAKAGNIENARQQSGAIGNSLIVIFDADQIAEPDFLLKTAAPFADPSIGWVQTGQYYSNLSNPIANWANDQQALFYKVLCPGKATQNAAFICGTNVVLRASALDEIGGLPQDSVTEDFAASIDLHPRWRSMFIADVLATGLGPMDLKSYFGQQRRWAIGTLGVLRSHWRNILLPRRNGLGFAQRLQYLLACTHYLCGVRDLIYLVAPLIFLLTGVAAVQGADLSGFLWHFLPYWVASQIAFWHIAWRRTTFRGIVIGFGSFPILLGSLLTVIIGRRVGFAVTSKQRASNSVWSQLTPHVLAVVACVATLIVVVARGQTSAPTAVSIIWVLYTLMMLGGMLWLGVADQRAARVPQHAVALPPRMPASSRLQPRWMLRSLVAGGLVLGTGGALIGVNRVAIAEPAAFVPRQENGPPLFGVSLPVELLDAKPAALEQSLGHSFAIVGRTQDITDRFDRKWADRLATKQSRPWVTLLFGAAGKPSLESSLPAISNGVHDAALREWAREIRAYGKPIYLTILPHVDRNWSLSSAVTNGGIPADVPRAWQHVRSIFQQEGALNVAWVWAPADPANDQIYAPPAATIDATLVSMISYPNATWADPALALDAVTARHATTPLLVEVSAAGDSARKATWLRAVGTAIAARSDVHALLYHEGAPELNATSQDHTIWSLASDTAVLRATQDMAATAGVQFSATAPVANR